MGHFSKKNRIIRKKTHMLKLACKFIEKRLQHRCFPVNIGKFQKSYFEEKLRTLGSEETLGRDWLGLSFWRVAFKTSWLSNITKIPVAFKPEPSLNLTPTLYFELRCPIFIINGYDSKANACSLWTFCLN